MIKMVDIGVMKLGESAGLKIVGISGWRNGTRLSLLQRRTLGWERWLCLRLDRFRIRISPAQRIYIFFKLTLKSSFVL